MRRATADGCAECGTDHSDYWPGSIGEKLACLGAQREAFRVDAARYLRGKDRKARAYRLLFRCLRLAR